MGLLDILKKALNQPTQQQQVLGRPQRDIPAPLARPDNQATPAVPYRRGAEDDGLVNGPQGLHPMNADVGHLRGRMQSRMGMYSPQDSDLIPGENYYQHSQNLFSRRPLEATSDSADAFQPLYPQDENRYY